MREHDGRCVLQERRRREARAATVRYLWGRGAARARVLAARSSFEDEVRERLGPGCGSGRPVAREVVECGWEDGADVQLTREIDDVDRRGDLVTRLVVALGGDQHAFAPVPFRKGGGEVNLETL